MGDGLWGFDGEAEVLGYRVCPVRPGGEAMGAIEGGIDLCTVEDLRVAGQVGLMWRIVDVLLRDAPTSCADAKVCHASVRCRFRWTNALR